MKKKLIAGMTSTALIASIGAPAFAANFSDVSGHWAAGYINKLVDAGVVNGVDAEHFAPDATLTRAQFAKFVTVALGLNTSSTTSSFSDVSGWAVGYVEAAKAAGIINGEDATHFNPEGLVTREAAAAMMVRALRTVGELQPGTALSFPDADQVSSWFKSDIEVAVANGLLNGKDGQLAPKGTATRAEAAALTDRLMTKAVEIAGYKVASVNAINAAQLQVKFTKAVASDSVVDTDGTLKTGVFTVTKVSGSGTVTVGDTSLATLSEDGKTLTITAASGAFNNIKFVVTTATDSVKAKDGKFLDKYVSDVLSAADTTAPTVSSVEKKDASTVRVKFSEPLSSAGTWSYELADGTAATVVATPNLAKGYVDLVIDSGVAAGKDIKATIIGAADYANNLISPNPVSVNFSKGQLDGTKPTVASLNVLGLNKFEIKFSEEVQGFAGDDVAIDSTTLDDYTAGSDPTTAEVGEAKVTQDTTDKTKYTVDLGSALGAGLHSVGLAANAVNDLSGEQIAAYSKVFEFKADTTAPKLVSSEVKKENGAEYLYVTFDESVNEGTDNALTAKQVKDYVTTSGTINLSGFVAVADTNNKQYKAPLNAVTFTPAAGSAAAISNGASYEVTLTGAFTDGSNALGTTTVTFTRGTDTDTNTPVILTTTDSGETGSLVAGNGILVVNNDTIRVTFDRQLDGASATNSANYQVNGLTVASATLLPNNVVEIKLAEGTNTLTGLRNVTITGVKSKDGVTMDAFTASEYFTENVKPYVTSATLIAPNKIKVVFNEAVDVAKVSKADFDVFVGTTQEDETTPFGVAPVGSNPTDKEFVITLANDLTSPEYAQTVTVKVVQDSDATSIIADANGNLVKAQEVAVAK